MVKRAWLLCGVVLALSLTTDAAFYVRQTLLECPSPKPLHVALPTDLRFSLEHNFSSRAPNGFEAWERLGMRLPKEKILVLAPEDESSYGATLLTSLAEFLDRANNARTVRLDFARPQPDSDVEPLLTLVIELVGPNTSPQLASILPSERSPGESIRVIGPFASRGFVNIVASLLRENSGLPTACRKINRRLFAKNLGPQHITIQLVPQADPEWLASVVMGLGRTVQLLSNAEL